MEANLDLPLRIWRRGPWNASPLMRGSDRFQAVIRLLVIVLALIAVPIAGTAGTVAYTSSAELVENDQAVKSIAAATIVAEPQETGPSQRYVSPRYEALVRWENDNHQETAVVSVDRDAAVGREMTLWLGADGRPTDPPRQAGSAAWDGIGTALAVLMAAWGAAVGLDWLIALLLNRRRGARWDAELRGLGRRIEK